MKKICCIVLVLTFMLTGCEKGDSEISNGWELFKTQPYVLESDLLTEYEQSYTIDDYTIALEETVYDSKTNVGYCLLSAKKKKGKVEAEILKGNTLNGYCFGGNFDRFCLAVYLSGFKNMHYAYDGDTLYIYIDFVANRSFDRTIYLYDYQEYPQPSRETPYKFKIADRTEAKEYDLKNNTKLYISPLGAAYISQKDDKPNKIKLVYEKDEVVLFDFVNDDKITSFKETEGNEVYAEYRVDESIDVNGIVDVKIE